MTLTTKERESMDDYFNRRGLGRLWENLKLFVEDREIAITDTINDDLEETFTEVYPCV